MADLHIDPLGNEGTHVTSAHYEGLPSCRMGLDNHDRQRPQIVVCIGGEEKRRAIGHLFPKHDLPQSQPLRSLTNLHIDASRSHLEMPRNELDQ